MKKNLIGIFSIVMIITSFAVNVVSKDQMISEVEKRNLQQFPDITFENFFNGELRDDLNKYVEDQFYNKIMFNKVKSWVNYNLFRKNVNNGIYLYERSLYDQVYPLKESKVDEFNKTIKYLQSLFPNESNVVIVPEKSMYLDNKHLKVDFSDFNSYLNMDIIDLYNVLNSNSYYNTDLHLNHKGAYEAYKVIISKLTKEDPYSVEFEKVSNDFYGYYTNKAMNFNVVDNVYQASNSILDELKVCFYNEKNRYQCQTGVYFNDYLETEDKYEMYLGGNKPVTVIENDNCDNDKELVIFKDSYALSIAPFIAQHYKKVTLIDLRLANEDFAKTFIEDNSEILYLYGFKTINDSSVSWFHKEYKINVEIAVLKVV